MAYCENCAADINWDDEPNPHCIPFCDPPTKSVIESLRSSLAATETRLIDCTLELVTMREKCEGLEKAGIRACCVMESTAQIFSHGSQNDLAHAIGLLAESQDLRSAIDAARSAQSDSPIPHGVCDDGVEVEEFEQCPRIVSRIVNREGIFDKGCVLRAGHSGRCHAEAVEPGSIEIGPRREVGE